MDKVIGIITLILMLTGLSIVVSKRANTARVLDSLLGGIANLQRNAISPIK